MGTVFDPLRGFQHGILSASDRFRSNRSWYIRTLFLIPADEVKDENGRLPSAARSFWVSQLFLGLVFLMALAAVSNFIGMVVG